MINHDHNDQSWSVMINHDQPGSEWSIMINHYQSHQSLPFMIIMINHDYNDQSWSWSIMINHDQSWSIMINHDQSWSIMINHDQSWSIMINHDQSWSMIDHVFFVLLGFQIWRRKIPSCVRSGKSQGPLGERPGRLLQKGEGVDWNGQRTETILSHKVGLNG